ncbi:MAG TPA: lysoplasmalogenase [Spirochaetota bacterium]|nr:lysoplasmalogenase [Spirochaetota bacterium]HPJ33994.1 lysoplasmalogenase [Spirochaetota bacterium]
MNTALAVKILIISATAVFVVRQVSVLLKKKFIRLITTPLITYFICGLAVVGVYNYGQGNQWMLLAALGLSLIADSVLMVEAADLFTHGLIFFLGTHILYNIVFATGYSFILSDIFTAVILIALMVYLIYRFYKSGKLGNMLLPVIIYVTALSLIVYFSVNGYIRNGGTSHALMMWGAILFYISDAILGWIQFVKYFRFATFYVWLFYAPGQFLIALSLFY